MNTTFTLELKKQPTKAGLYPIYIRITRDRQSKRVKTTIALKSIQDWNSKKKEVRSSESRYKVWNEQLQIELEEAKQVYRERKGDSIAAVVDSIKNRGASESFLSFAKSKVEESKSIQSVGTYKHYVSAVNMLESFLKSKKKADISFNEITIPFLKEYESYLGSVANDREQGRTIKKNTIASYLKRLRKLVNEAVQEGYIANSPFGKGGGKFSIVDKAGGTKEVLDKDEVNRIQNLELPEGSAEWHTRNAYLFSFYCAGIRVGDMMQLRWENVKGGSLYYDMDKTDTDVAFKLSQTALGILALYKSENVKDSDYIFPFLDSNADYAKESERGRDTMPYELREALYRKISSRTAIANKNLKKIAEKAGITKNLTFHTSRHSWANDGRITGIQLPVLSKSLRHQKVTMTQGYMNHFGNEEVDAALRIVDEYINKSKPVESPKEALISQLRGLDKETLAEVLKGLEKV